MSTHALSSCRPFFLFQNDLARPRSRQVIYLEAIVYATLHDKDNVARMFINFIEPNVALSGVSVAARYSERTLVSTCYIYND